MKVVSIWAGVPPCAAVRASPPCEMAGPRPCLLLLLASLLGPSTPAPALPNSYLPPPPEVVTKKLAGSSHSPPLPLPQSLCAAL